MRLFRPKQCSAKHLIAIKTTWSARSGAQYKWLEADLEKVDRSVTPWLIAGWHAPWYTTYKAHYREAECMRVEMEELLYAYGVDVVFTGHVSLRRRLLSTS